ncbi:alpha/beta hydrolase [uncultured Jatrophihabitans sp.]|uniref:alpha/beta hydrolase n=1 Tax=uncultured Jatrophihabitans sp. TaxID=1610747 RepID=UPI0035CA65C6
MRKLIAVVSAVVAAAALTTVPNVAQAGPAAPSVRTPAVYQPPAIAWHACSDDVLKKLGAQCGYLTVPLDYAFPEGRKIKIAVSRLLHKSRAASYQGAMFTNPGGPGGSGLDLVVLAQFVPGHVGDDYDWYGFDPRGVGASIPSLTCDAKFFKGDRPSYEPKTSAAYEAWIKRSKAYAAACAKSPGHALFNHVTTTDSVADMESLRRAIGRRQINYYGFSYGTYLGTVYASLHPSRVRRFVLDSTVDPRGVWYKGNLDQDVAFQKTFRIYLRWLAKYHSVYHVGKTYQAVRAKYLATIDKLDRHAAGGVLGGDELIDDFTSAGYYVYGWEDIAKAYSAYLNHNNPKPLIKLYTDANSTAPGGDNEYALYLGTQCTDAQWPPSQSKLNADSRRLNKNYFYLTWSNAWFNGPCAYWHFPSRVHAFSVTANVVKSKILMIDETFDPATPYEGSLYVRKLFPGASLIEGKDGTTHAGSLSGVACTDVAIATYLATGKTPARRSGNRSDKVCPPVPKPNPLARSAASTGNAARSAVLLKVLTEAQLR